MTAPAPPAPAPEFMCDDHAYLGPVPCPHDHGDGCDAPAPPAPRSKLKDLIYAEAEIAALKERVETMLRGAIGLAKTLLEQRAEMDRLRKAIENAPHGPCNPCGDFGYEEQPPCTCWKAAALAEEGK